MHYRVPRHALANHIVPTHNFIIRLEEGHFGSHCIVEKIKLLQYNDKKCV